MGRPEKLKLAEVLVEIKMSRAAFYRMRARSQAPASISFPTANSA